MKRIAILLALIIFATSCDDSTVQEDAVLMTVEELAVTPGYTWFNTEYELYQPDQTVIDQIKELYSIDDHDFLIFVQPSCSCPGTHRLFPKFVKSMNISGIDESEYKIYSMSSTSTHTPYDTMLTINRLPAFFVLKNGQPIYSIIDTIDYNYLHDILYPNKIEEYLLEALKH